MNAADYDRNFFEKLKGRMPKIIPSYICPRNPYQFSSGAAVQELHDDKKEWIALPDLPPRRLIAQIIGCEVSKVDEILLLWIRGGIFKKIHRSLLIRREKLLENLQWLSQFA